MALPKLCYTIPEMSEAVGFGRTKLYEDIKAGRLKAHMAGGRTVVLADNANEYVKSFAPLAPRTTNSRKASAGTLAAA